MKQLGQISDVSLIDARDTFVAYCSPIQGTDIGYLYSFAGKRNLNQDTSTALQFFYTYNGTNLYFRFYSTSSNSWNPWKKIALTT